VLEFGANGITVPHCRSAEEARQWVEWANSRQKESAATICAGANANFALSDTLEFLQERNQETFRVFQIEDREAVACIEEIATTDRVDGLFIGPRDLTISYGIPFKRKDPLIKRAMDEVANAAAKAGKGWGTVSETPGKRTKGIDRGARMVTCADDHMPTTTYCWWHCDSIGRAQPGSKWQSLRGRYRSRRDTGFVR